MCELSDFFWMELSPKHRQLVKAELDYWHKWYIPPNGIKGTVLDVGAGCGETANFYLAHGAERVICIESDPQALLYLYVNYRRDPRILIIPDRIDRVKIDIEGSEEGMVYETHFQHRLKRFGCVYPEQGIPEGSYCYRLERS